MILKEFGILGKFERYLDYHKELMKVAEKYGENGDRVAYAVNYLGLPPETITKVMESWYRLPFDVKTFMGGFVPTPTATIVADELSHPDTTYYAQLYPKLLWIHAHTNAIFTFPWIKYVQKKDPRLIKMADLRLSEGPVKIGKQILDIYYPEYGPTKFIYGKRKYIREGFKFFAEKFGGELNKMSIQSLSIICEQSTAMAVTIEFEESYNNFVVQPGETFIFFNTQNVPLYCFTSVDNTIALGSSVPKGALSVGMCTMKKFRDKYPNLKNSPNLPLNQEGYVLLDTIWNQDKQFENYLHQGFYKGYFATSPVERTFAWKEYQTVGLVPEQTVRGYGIEKVGNAYPAWMQPLSLLEDFPDLVEFLVSSPEVYVPAKWHKGVLFEPYRS
jgi:hypothetical protein